MTGSGSVSLSTKYVFVSLFTLLFSCVCIPVHADDETAARILENAIVDYESAEDEAAIEKTISDINVALDETTNVDLTYRLSLLRSKAYLRQARFISNDDRNDLEKERQQGNLLSRAKESAQAALRLNDSLADAHYQYAVSLQNLGSLRGFLAFALDYKEVVGHCIIAKERQTIDGLPGETLDHYGPDRVLGMYHPNGEGHYGAANLVFKNRIASLEEAYRKAPDYKLNAIVLAQALLMGFKETRDEKRGLELIEEALDASVEGLTPGERRELEIVLKQVRQYVERRKRN